MTSASSKSLPLIGILGDGQLSKMSIEAYHKIGGKAYAFGGSDQSPAGLVADKFVTGSAESLSDLTEFFKQVDVVTLENEFIDSNLLIQASQDSGIKVFPEPSRYQLIEDKLSEKRFFSESGTQVAKFFEVNEVSDLIDTPGYLKLAKGGYDGKGTYKVDSLAEAAEVFTKIRSAGAVLFEHALDYAKELSMIAARNSSSIIFYPLVETHQDHGTCRYVSLPAGVSDAIEQQARHDTGQIMQKLDTQGLFAFEFFLTPSGELIVNESAPRPHNSGHITMDLMSGDQFENHMRSVADLPLVEPQMQHASGIMVNLLGTQDGPVNEKAIFDDAGTEDLKVHLYGKTESRVNRKMGHINLWGDNQWQRAKQLVKTLEV